MADDFEDASPSLSERLAEKAPAPIIVPRRTLNRVTRRDFLVYGAGVAAAAAGFWAALPPETQERLGRKGAHTFAAKERFLNGSLSFDDDVAAAFYSPDRLVPTYSRADITPNLRNNYDGQTPDPDYIANWHLTVTGLASGATEQFAASDIAGLARRYERHEQITRLVCVEGWSAIAWWAGLRFADFLTEFPPAPDALWARLDSSVNLDSDGNSDPYYVSIDLPTARHPQTLLATHQNDVPLTVEHGAPLRLVAPMKLGLKNIKAITKITYMSSRPADYWNERGYSQYDGL